MAYEGEVLTQCNVQLFRNKDFNVIVVNGDFPNPCGHALLNFGGLTGYYAQVHGVLDVPVYMDQSGFERYKRENHKTELIRQKLDIPNPPAAFRHFEELLSKKWFWGVLIHNCASFVEEIVHAGGGRLDIINNCPIALFKKHPRNARIFERGVFVR